MNPLFPDCTIHHMPQRSPEWVEIRKDKLTATGMGAWLAEKRECRLTVPDIKLALDAKGIAYKASAKRDDLLALGEAWPETHLKGTTDARHTAICKILGGMSKAQCPDPFEVDPDGPPPRNPALWAVWNGLRLEKEAVFAFEEKMWIKDLTQVGFAVHKSGAAGCSPDGLFPDAPFGFEGKCPLPATHVDYLLKGELPPFYRDQVHGSMAVTGAQGWWFQSYCPGLPTFRIFTMRDDYTERMASGLWEFAECLKSATEEIASLWDAEFAGRDDV